MSNAPKFNHASSLCVEDHLKKLLSMTTGKTWHQSDNKLLPRNQHSCFGDFPEEYMKNIKKDKVQAVPKIENAEASAAASGKGKLI